MPAIITVTFNPTIDKSVSIAGLVPDKKLRCTITDCEAGGGGINVARAIAKLGGDAVAVYLSGGDTGKKIAKLLHRDSVKSIAVKIKDNSRENLVVEDISVNKQYLFDMPGPEVTYREWKNCLAKIGAIDDVEYIVASGSLPPGIPAEIFGQLADLARNKNAKLIVDTSGEGLKQALKAGVYLIKPNIRELASLAAKDGLDTDSIAVAARQLMNQGDCGVIVVSMGAQGALLVTEEQTVHIAAPSLPVESTVGAGDSMLAGMVLSLAAKKSLIESVQYGVACGTAATIKPGTRLCTKEDADRIYQAIQAKRLLNIQTVSSCI